MPPGAQLVRLRGDNRRPLLGVIAVVVIVTLAVLKPWAGPGDPSRVTTPADPSGGPAGTPGPAATPSPTPPGYDAPGGQCYPDAGWRVYTVETRTGRRLRTWLTIDPLAAASPRDPAVPFVKIVTENLLGLGFCVGSGPDGPGPLVGTRAWSVPPGGPAIQLALAPLVEHMPYAPDLGAVYLPAAAPGADVGAGWSPGRYIFAVRQGSQQGDEWWFGVDIVAVPGVTPAP